MNPQNNTPTTGKNHHRIFSRGETSPLIPSVLRCNKSEQTRVLSERIRWQARDNCTIYSESDVEAEVLTEIAQAFFNSHNQGEFEA